jgi:hypothetical protein
MQQRYHYEFHQFSVEFPLKLTPLRKTLIEEEEEEPKPEEDADPQQA